MSEQTRQEFIRAAVSFLQNPKLSDSSLQDKLKFLKNKGLSQVEVDEALNLALINRQQPAQGKWNFLLILGLCVGGYKLYQLYLESLGKSTDDQSEKTKREVARNQQELEISKKDRDQPTLQNILSQMAELKRLIESHRSAFSTDIQSLKTLLLGHEKFAAPPTIPSWQLNDSKNSKETDSSSNGIKSGKASKDKFIGEEVIAPIPQ